MVHRRHCVLAVLLFAVSCAVTARAAERTIDLTASDGTRLKASYFPAAKPGPGILLLHQCNRQRKVWDGLAQQLAASGMNVLTFDYRGFGESGGTPEAKLTAAEIGKQRANWPGDITLAFNYLLSQPGVNKDMIGLGGASCGVFLSLQMAIRHADVVHSLVLLSGPANRKGREFLRTSRTAPEFFAAADDDEFPETVVETEWQYNITGNPGKKFVHEATGGHGADMFQVHPELVTEIVDWYVTTLIKTPGHAPASHDNFKPSEEVLALSLIDEPGGATEVSSMLAEARKKNPGATLFPETTVNVIGYEFLQGGDKKSALEVMKLNVAAYPRSPNAYDSLSDAYLAAGQKELALEATKKSLELLQTDTTDPQQQKDAIKASAEGKLKQLQTRPQ